jgi:hypothetical protein
MSTEGQFTFLPWKRNAIGKLVKGAKSKLSLASCLPIESLWLSVGIKGSAGDSLLFAPCVSQQLPGFSGARK